MTRRRFEIFKLAGEIRRADAEDLPFHNATFDMVWSWGVHHSNSMERSLSEMTRVLRCGGRLFRWSIIAQALFTTCIVDSSVELLGQFLYRSLQQIYTAASDGFFARVSTKKELKLLLQSYECISMTVVGLKAELFPLPRTRFKIKLEQLTPNRVATSILNLWGSMIVVEAIKKTEK